MEALHWAAALCRSAFQESTHVGDSLSPRKFHQAFLSSSVIFVWVSSGWKETSVFNKPTHLEERLSELEDIYTEALSWQAWHTLKTPQKPWHLLSVAPKLMMFLSTFKQSLKISFYFNLIVCHLSLKIFRYHHLIAAVSSLNFLSYPYSFWILFLQCWGWSRGLLQAKKMLNRWAVSLSLHSEFIS